MRNLQILLILTLLVGEAFCESPTKPKSHVAQPVALIVGHNTAVPGELVMLKTTGSQGGVLYRWDSFPNSTPHFFWPVLLPTGVGPDGQLTYENAAIFSSLNQGRFAIILAVAESNQPALCVHEIAVGNDPGPNPPDPPDPPDPPPPDQKWQVVIVYEMNDLDNLPGSQQAIISGLVFRKALADAGHALVPGGIVDQHIKDKDGKVPTPLVAYLEACEGDPLPRICIAPFSGGDVRDYPLPITEAGVLELLEDPPAVRCPPQRPIKTTIRPRPKVQTKWIWAGPGMRAQVPIGWQGREYCPGGVCP